MQETGKTFNFNLYAGAFLATVFAAMTLSLLSDAIFHVETPEQQGFAIEVTESSGQAAADEEPEEIALIAPLLASADVDAGETVFRKCQACHNVEPGGANKVGPNLWNIVNAQAGNADGFGYSSGMVAYAVADNKWDFEALNRFLLRPKDYIEGTSMGFAGLKKEDDRANLIAWLVQQADSPVPLPE